MNLSEVDSIEKYGKEGDHFSRNTLLPYEHEVTCFVCGFNLIKRKHELHKTQRKKNYQSKKICRTQDLLSLRRCI